jgi:hypothetical protein
VTRGETLLAHVFDHGQTPRRRPTRGQAMNAALAPDDGVEAAPRFSELLAPVGHVRVGIVESADAGCAKVIFDDVTRGELLSIDVDEERRMTGIAHGVVADPEGCVRQSSLRASQRGAT